MNELKPLHQKFRKFNLKKLIAFDTEDDSEGNVTICSFFDGISFTVFTKDIHEKADKFIMSHKGFYFVGLNVLYDLVNIYGASNLVEFHELFFGKNNFVFSKDENKNVFFDLFWLMPYSLKRIGEIVGLEKLKADFSSTEYNKRDSEVTYRATRMILKFFNDNKWDFGYTLASVALKIFRRHYQKHSYINYDTKFTESLKFVYYGGRTEQFVKGEIHGKINVYDVNSLYPYVMKNNIFPNPNKFKKTKEISELGIYEIDVKIKKDTYLPLICKREERLVFPVGEFHTFATGAEIIQAQNQIEKIKIINGYKFAKGHYYFADFVKNLYQMRIDNKNKFEMTVIKLIMNSLYGKFFQGREHIVWDGKEFITEVDEEFPVNTIPIFSIFVTAFARVHMHKLMSGLLEKGHRIYYTDTDSIHTDGTMQTGKQLGQVKLEGVFNYGKYIAPKMYLLDGQNGEIIKTKGIPKDMQKEFLENYIVSFKRPVKLRESFRRGLKANNWQEITKHFLDSNDKRNFSSDNSSPLIMKF